MKNLFSPTQVKVIVFLGILIGILTASFIYLSRKDTAVASTKVTLPKLTGGNDVLTPEEYSKLKTDLVALVDGKDPAAALQYLSKQMSGSTKIDNNCHPLAHAVGNATYLKFKNTEKAFSYQDDLCGSGYMHGVVETILASATNLNSVKDTICASTDGTCFLSLGGGFMYATKNDLPKSLELCDTFKTENQRVNCYDGVFMENFATLQKDALSTYLNEKDTLYPCAENKAAYKSSCYFYSSQYYLSLHKSDYSGALKTCSQAEPAYQWSCTMGVGSIMTKENIHNVVAVENMCQKASPSQTTACIDGMVNYFIVHFNSIDKGNELCKQLDPTHWESCYNSVKARLNDAKTDSAANSKSVMGTSTKNGDTEVIRHTFDF